MKKIRCTILAASLLVHVHTIIGMMNYDYRQKCDEIVGYVSIDTFMHALDMMTELERTYEAEKRSMAFEELEAMDTIFDEAKAAINERIAHKFKAFIEKHIIAFPKTGILSLGSVLESYMHSFMHGVDGSLVMESMGLKDLLYNEENRAAVRQDIQRTIGKATEAVLLAIADFVYLDSLVPVVMNNMGAVESLLEDHEWYMLGIPIDQYVDKAQATANVTVKNIVAQAITQAQREKKPRDIEKLYRDYYTEFSYTDNDGQEVTMQPISELLFAVANRDEIAEEIGQLLTDARGALKMFQTRITIENIMQQLDMARDFLGRQFNLDKAVATKRFIIQTGQLFAQMVSVLEKDTVYDVQGQLRALRQLFNEKLKTAFIAKINDAITTAGNQAIANLEPILLDYITTFSYQKNGRLVWSDTSLKKLFFHTRELPALWTAVEEKLQTATRTVCSRIVGLYETVEDLVPVIMNNIAVINDLMMPEQWKEMHIPIEKIIMQTEIKVNERTKTVILAGISQGTEEDVAALREKYEEGFSYTDSDGATMHTVGISTLLYDVSNKKAVQEAVEHALH
jgi:hypothetical protein